MPSDKEVLTELISMIREDSPSPEGYGIAARLIVNKVPDALARRYAARYLAEMARGSARRETLAEERAAMRKQILEELTATGTPVKRRHRPVDVEAEAAASAIREAFFAEMQASLERFVTELRIEWTAELRAATFTLADGTVTTWGSASVDQHRERCAMFTGYAAANAEGAARHARAIADIEAASVGTLNELSEREAVLS